GDGDRPALAAHGVVGDGQGQGRGPQRDQAAGRAAIDERNHEERGQAGQDSGQGALVTGQGPVRPETHAEQHGQHGYSRRRAELAQHGPLPSGSPRSAPASRARRRSKRMGSPATFEGEPSRRVMNNAPRPSTWYAPALSRGSPVATY